MKKSIYLIVGVLALCVFMSGQVFALGFNISVARVYLEVEPGKTYEGFVNIGRAPEQKIIPVEVIINDWKYNNETRQIEELPFNSQPDSCSSWLNLSPTNFELNDDLQKVKVHYSINVPSELDFPEYYSTVYFMSKLPEAVVDIAAVGLKMEAKIGVIFKMTVKNLARVKGEPVSFEVSYNEDEESYDLKYAISNTGNTLLIVEGNYNVIDEEGNLYGRGSIRRTPVSQGATSEMLTQWYGSLEPGEYDFIRTFELGDQAGDIHVSEYRYSQE